MRKLYGAVLVSVVLVHSLFGVSPALAQNEPRNEEIGVSVDRGSANRTALQVSPVSTELMEELDRLGRMLEEAERRNDRELIEALQKKIQVIKEEIRKGTERPGTPQLATKKPVQTAPKDVTTVSPVNTDKCAELKAWEIKKERYEAIYALSDEELRKKGYRGGKEEVRKVIADLDAGIERLRVACEATRTGTQQRTTDTPIRVLPKDVTTVSPVNTDKCAELKAWEIKKERYEAIYALSDEELRNKGYRGGKEEVSKVIAEIDAGIERLRAGCELGRTQTQQTTEAVSTKLRPTVVESGDEITDYYKRRIAEMAIEEVETEKQIVNLKELRNEIDRLIEELVKSKDKINTEEVSGLVTKIEVRPGELTMDNTVVSTIDKSVVTRVNGKELEIKPTKDHVVILDGNLETKAMALSIEDGVLRTGDSEVKIMPSTVIEKIMVEPKEIELKEGNATAVYIIRADENRKLFGFIPVKVEKTITVNAANTEAKIINEKRPWWSFLTTK